ncbi:PEP-CTERM sorting domain-containing protein [Pseudomaricurvus sp. HS19]|uniref:PEP-CTERM sorting domain-containing protein n=1 Tax=Pseudomaricurvus sp. HS19 TaxID=2692626 RepID=UPI00136AF0CF|nr:PEP-CTERM sorting domain-containing protein [Pseudomaricurvus sp. HS19]MYM62009.1 PEP-CTERM sorting domain-containing protein [Pseudomaricurvus sp. HS19]
MNKLIASMALPLLMATSAMSNAAEVVIDFFDSSAAGFPFLQLVDDDDTDLVGDFVTDDGPVATILGGYRDVEVVCLDGCTFDSGPAVGLPNGSESSVTIAGGLFSFNNDSGVVGEARINYDGLGGAGLGGVDLTAGGAINALVLDVFSSDGGISNEWYFQIYVEDQSGGFSVVTLQALEVIAPGGSFPLFYSMFTDCALANVECSAGDTIPVDLTDVDVITILLNVNNGSGLLDDLDLRLRGISAKVPEPEMLSIMGLGLLVMGLAGGRRRRLKK